MSEDGKGQANEEILVDEKLFEGTILSEVEVREA